MLWTDFEVTTSDNHFRAASAAAATEGSAAAGGVPVKSLTTTSAIADYVMEKTTLARRQLTCLFTHEHPAERLQFHILIDKVYFNIMILNIYLKTKTVIMSL